MYVLECACGERYNNDFHIIFVCEADLEILMLYVS